MKKNMKKIISLFVTVAMLSTLLTGCGSGKGSENAPAEEANEAADNTNTATESDKPVKVAMLIYSLSAPACQAVAIPIKAEAEALGVELIEMDAEGDPAKQATQIDNAITQGVDAVILNPTDAKSLIPSCKKLKDAGIGLIVMGMQIDESAQDLLDTFVGGDDLEVGKRCGEMMKTALPEGGLVAIVEGAAGTDPQIKRSQGFEEAVAGSNIEIAGKENGDWTAEGAMSAAEDFIVKYPDLKGIFVQDDTMSIGVVEAVKAAGKIGEIQIVSYNGNKIGCEEVKNGEIYGTAQQDCDYIGKQALDACVDYANGKTLEKEYHDEIIPITKENVDQFNPNW